MQGPFTYEALPPEDIKFVPLKQTREFNAAELMQVSYPGGSGDNTSLQLLAANDLKAGCLSGGD